MVLIIVDKKNSIEMNDLEVYVGHATSVTQKAELAQKVKILSKRLT